VLAADLLVERREDLLQPVGVARVSSRCDEKA
jgi:hypothetical protein